MDASLSAGAVNPFAAPLTGPESGFASPASHDERKVSRRKRSIRAIGLLYYLAGGFASLGFLSLAVGVAVAIFAPDNAAPPPYNRMDMVMATILLGACASLYISVGRGLRRFEKGARKWCIGMSVLSLVNLPFGSLVGVAALITLCNRTSKEIFEANAKVPAEATTTRSSRGEKTASGGYLQLAFSVSVLAAFGFLAFLAII